MSGHSIAWLKEWANGRDELDSELNGHVKTILAALERANVCVPADQTDTPLVPMAAECKGRDHFTERMRDRYHYALSQMEKARDYLLSGRGAMAVDALWRAKDGISE